MRTGDNRLYRIWKAMRTRCNNPNFFAYKYYGGKGVSICEDWDDYDLFSIWAKDNGYSKNLTIDRINSDGDYNPLNCRWITLEEQQLNKSNNVPQYIYGKKMSVRQISEEYTIAEGTLWSRLKAGLSNEELIKPVRKAERFDIKGENMSMEEISHRFDIPWSTIRSRYARGLRGIDLLGGSYE